MQSSVKGLGRGSCREIGKVSGEKSVHVRSRLPRIVLGDLSSNLANVVRYLLAHVRSKRSIKLRVVEAALLEDSQLAKVGGVNKA